MMVCCQGGCALSVPLFSYENEMLHFQKLFPRRQFLKGNCRSSHHHVSTIITGTGSSVALKQPIVVCYVFEIESKFLSSKLIHALSTYLRLTLLEENSLSVKIRLFTIPVIMHVIQSQCLFRKRRFKVDYTHLHTPSHLKWSKQTKLSLRKMCKSYRQKDPRKIYNCFTNT